MNMKIYIFLIFFVTTLLSSACNKYEIQNTDDQVGISKVTHFAILELKGERFTAIPLGAAFNDPGITAREGSTEIPFTVSGSVDINSVGVYTLVYTAINKDNFPASITRTVAVYSTDASAAGNDLSGTYVRTANGVSCTWTRIAPGVYTVVNPGGAPGFTTTVIVFNPTGLTINIPSQRVDDGSMMTSSDEIYTNGSPAQYVWRILNPVYGTGLRTFVKQ